MKSLGNAAGFSLIELVTVIALLGVLAAVVAPRLAGSRQGYDNLGFYNNTKAILRYAQKSAIAERRTVCVGFTTTSVTVTFASAPGAAACNANLIGPAGENPYIVTAAASTTFAPAPTNFTFNTLGQPSLGQVITIAGGVANITVNTDTGYVQ
jgi:MSHA pilin protein MshC